jgi:segregation and condensation protein A
MVRKGELNPWNVDVVEIADKFLKRLEEAKKLDLRVSGRVLLYAAILVRMKADVLATEAVSYSEESGDDLEVLDEEFLIDDFGFDISLDFHDYNFESYPQELPEPSYDEVEDEILAALLSTPVRKARRYTTLKDLIEELRRAEEVQKRRRRKRRQADEVVPDRTMETPHEEDIEETIIKVESELLSILAKRRPVFFSQVVRGKNTGEVVSYYISILHLSFRKKLSINQERIFDSDIEIDIELNR